MRGFQPAAKRAAHFANGGAVRGFKGGGPVRGPGTGTSDDVPDNVPSGTYIMPADSTQAMGEQQLAALGGEPRGFAPGAAQGKGVPVQLSNGEFKLPPEQVHAVGVQALDQMKNATHEPVSARGFSPGGRGAPQRAEPPLFFADGGVARGLPARRGYYDGGNVEEEKKRAANAGMAVAPVPTTAPPPVPQASAAPAPGNTFPGNRLQGNSGMSGAPAPAAAAAAAAAPAPEPAAAPQPSPQAQSDRAAIGSAWETVKDASNDAGRAIADVATLVPRGLVGAYDSAVVRPMRAAGFDAAYLSPKLVPDGVDPASMTPFTDQKRMQKAATAAPSPETAQAQTKGLPGFDPSQWAEAVPKIDTIKAVEAPAAAPEVGQIGNRTTLTNAQAAIMNPAGRITAQRGADGVMSFSGNDVRGQVSYNDASGKALPGGGLGARGFAGFEVAPAGSNMTMDSQGNYAFDSTPRGAATGGAAPAAGAAPAVASARTAAGQAPQAGWTGVIGSDPTAGRERKELIDKLTTPHKGSPNGQLTLGQMNALNSLYDREARSAQAEANNATSLQQTQMQGDANRDIAGMREAGDNSRAVMRETSENARVGARNAIDQGRLDLEKQARGADIRAGERQEKLHQKYEAAKTPEERDAIAKQIRDLQGKPEQSPWRVQVTPATKNIDGSTTEGSVIRYNDQTGAVEKVDVGGPQAPKVPIEQNPQAIAIRQNAAMTPEQKMIALSNLGY